MDDSNVTILLTILLSITPKSKIGSLSNIKHTPGGGKVKLENQKMDFSNVKSKCGTFSNVNHKPKGGDVKIVEQKLDLSKVKSKCGSMDNAKHRPGGNKSRTVLKSLNPDQSSSSISGGNVKINSRRSNFTGVKSKCGSLDYVKHVPGKQLTISKYDSYIMTHISIKVVVMLKSLMKNSKSKRRASVEHLITLIIKPVEVTSKYFMRNCHGKNQMIQHLNLVR